MTSKVARPARKSTYSNPSGNCVCMERREDGFVYVWHTDRPKETIRYTVAEIDAFLKGAKDKQFDDLVDPLPAGV